MSRLLNPGADLVSSGRSVPIYDQVQPAKSQRVRVQLRDAGNDSTPSYDFTQIARRLWGSRAATGRRSTT